MWRPIALSNYARELPADVLNNYYRRIENVEIDPFYIQKWNLRWITITSEQLEKNLEEVNIPPIQKIDIFEYYVNAKSFYTNLEFRSFKGIDSYNAFISHHVLDVKWIFKNDHFIVLGKVKHSQSQTLPPVNVWLLLTSNGQIKTVHCTCVAGNGEACSHTGAVCVYLREFNRAKMKKTCTDVKCYWVQPSGSIKKLSPKKLGQVCYDNVRKIKKNDGKIKQRKPITFKLPPIADVKTLLPFINKAYPSAGLLRSFKPYCKKPEKYEFPKVLCNLENDKLENLKLKEIIAIGKKLNFSLTEVQISEIEKDSRDQSKSKSWNEYRAGRLTASNMRDICRVGSFSSNKSLLNKICYPEKTTFKTSATIWGCRHEKTALGKYLNEQRSEHQNLEVRKCGLFINKTMPYIAASPDGIVECSCCGVGLVEIKCPFCARDADLDSMKYLDTESGFMGLQQDHLYYYQVQTQMFCVGYDFTDFVVWNPSAILVERIYKNTNVFKHIAQKASAYFYNAVLPELLCRYYSKNETYEHVTMHKPTFCICGTNTRGKVIFCSREGCAIIRFHISYVNLKNIRKNWICSACSA